jgi:hypothetical protein
MNNKQGFILLHRKIWESKDFNSTLETVIFIYLLSKACHEPTKVLYRRKRISLQRGEVCIALRDLAKKFEITVKRTRTIINNLVRAQNMAQRLAQTLSVYSIVKYDKYQKLDKSKAQEKAQDRAYRTNNINKSNKSIYTSMDNKYKKVDIKSSKPALKDLKQTIYNNESVSEFEIARQRLSKDRFEEFVKFKLAESNKSN